MSIFLDKIRKDEPEFKEKITLKLKNMDTNIF